MHPLRKYRLKKGLTVEQLAQRLGVAKSAVSRWENGVMIPRPATMRLVMEVTGGAVRPEHFYGAARRNRGEDAA